MSLKKRFHPEAWKKIGQVAGDLTYRDLLVGRELAPDRVRRAHRSRGTACRARSKKREKSQVTGDLAYEQNRMSVIKDTIKGFWNLLIGLKTTAKYLPTRAVTLQYPDERWPMPERSRGVVVLLSDPETGELNCNACLVCMRQCPVSAITVTQAKNEKGERYPEIFTIDNTLCCFCGICEEVCNFNAIKLTGKYEFSVFKKEDLIYDKARLQEIGRDVKYEPKKKAKSATQTAGKPAEGSAAPAAEKPAENKATTQSEGSGEEKA